MNLTSLQTLPAGLDASFALIEGLDECLYAGFGRLGDTHKEALGKLQATFAGSPLEQSLNDGIAAIMRSEFLSKHFVTVAAARAALLGAQYDALAAQARAATGLAAEELDEPPPEAPGAAASILGSTQQWLMELALAGFAHLEESSVAPFTATLEQLHAAPRLSGLSALLTGFFNELAAHVPTGRQTALPVFRWADLWSGAMIRAQAISGERPFETAAGSLIPLGLDVRCHANFVCANLYGIFKSDGAYRTVRAPFSSYKVDVIAGAEIWDLFPDFGEPILKALEEHKALEIAGAELHGKANLILKSKPKVGKAVDPFETMEHLTALPKPPAISRHPIHLGEPIHAAVPLELPWASERLPIDTELDEKALQSAEQVIGLLRFDRGGWRVQPLCVRGAKGHILSGEGLQKRRAKLKEDTLAVLQERASKLLRE